MSRIQLFKSKSIITPAASLRRSKAMPKTSEEPLDPTTTPTLSPSYLTTTANVSERIQDPSSSRKLLVLDLNGSLLIRPKRSAHPKSKARRGGEDVQRTRAVHPRPYIPSFREYISHPKTQSWLDTMVWSSAQPHSVKDMVEKCFERGKNDYSGLRAMMARDTMNLTEAQYCTYSVFRPRKLNIILLLANKSVTTKDLEVIWSKNAFESSPALASMVPESLNNAQPFAHSPQTTVLLDDSPLKARMQPWNHICLVDYASGLRNADLEVWRSMQTLTATKKKRKRRKKHNNDALVEEEQPVVVEIDPQVTELSPAQSPGKFDETMLAVIGILERIQHESNVGSWIRQGGLLTGGVERETNPEAVAPITDRDDKNPMWFNDADVANSWAERGKLALQDLKIELIHGIHD